MLIRVPKPQFANTSTHQLLNPSTPQPLNPSTYQPLNIMNQLFKKLSCCHQWQEIHRENYESFPFKTRILYKCTTCGKLVLKEV